MQQAVDARYYLEKWVRWAIGARVYERSHTGRLMEGLGHKTCPLCRGQGRVPGSLVGSTAQSEVCPNCDGQREVKGDIEAIKLIHTVRCKHCMVVDRHGNKTYPGEINGHTCIKCRGSGWRTLIDLTVHPAGIRGTRYGDANQDDDPISMLIDRTVAGWGALDATKWMQLVVIAEYTGTVHDRYVGSTQSQKAKALRISQAYFSQQLSRAHREIEAIVLEQKEGCT